MNYEDAGTCHYIMFTYPTFVGKYSLLHCINELLNGWRRHAHPLCTEFHPHSVLLWTEYQDPAIFLPIRLEPFKYCLQKATRHSLAFSPYKKKITAATKNLGPSQ